MVSSNPKYGFICNPKYYCIQCNPKAQLWLHAIPNMVFYETPNIIACNATPRPNYGYIQSQIWFYMQPQIVLHAIPNIVTCNPKYGFICNPKYCYILTQIIKYCYMQPQMTILYVTE